MNHNVFLSLGSNMGDRGKYLIDALIYISHIGNVSIRDISNIYETDPVGYTQQDCFLNMAVKICTDLGPKELLEELQRVEKLLKRERITRWGPRTIDIDILLYDDIRFSSPQLTIPHPRMFERAFVLVPLKEVYEHRELFGINIDNALDKCSDKDGIRIYKKISVCDLRRI